MRTEQIVTRLRQLPNGWRGGESKKPAAKAVRKIQRILSAIELGHMPWPNVDAVANGGLILTWTSLTRDILLTIDTDGDAQFVTSLKVLDPDKIEIIDRVDSEGHVSDVRTIDHMMAWYMMDKAAKC